MGGKNNKRVDSYQMNDGIVFYDYPGQREEIRASHATMLKRHQLRKKTKEMKKEDFTIEGSTALKKAFVEESGLQMAGSRSIIDYRYMISSDTKEVLEGSDYICTKHFILPDQYNEALEYVKNFWKKDETFEAGEYAVVNIGMDEITVQVMDVFPNCFTYGLKGLIYTAENKNARKATPEEIEKAQTKKVFVSSQFFVKLNHKGIFYNERNITDVVKDILILPLNGEAGDYNFRVKDINFEYIDFMPFETKLSDWQKVWEEYQKIKK